MSERKIVTVAEVDYDFCAWEYGQGDVGGVSHYYEFENDLTDSVGDADGTAVGTTSFQTGVFGQALRVEDTDGVTLPISISPGLYPDGIALAFYAKPNFNITVGSDQDSNAENGFFLTVTSSLVTWQVGSVDERDSWSVSNSNSSYSWYAIDFDGETVRVIKDGSVLTEGVGTLGTPTEPFKIKTSSNDADIDDLRIYHRTLTDDELSNFGSQSKPTGCTAVLGTDGDAKCFNTRATCQDPDNFNRGTRVLRFIKPSGFEPKSLAAIPSINRVQTSPARIRPGEDLGERASVSVDFDDHPYHDRTVDQYALERVSGAAQASGVGYDPSERGTYWGKWRARNPYFQNRGLRIIQGTLEQAEADPSALSEMETRHYVMESIDGPTADGRFTITAKDILKLADDDRAQAPVASQGVLDSDITAGATSLTLSPSGVGDDEYPASGYVTVGNEVMAFTRSGDTMTITRAQYGTAADSHASGDSVQLAIEFDSEKASAIVKTLLVDYANVSDTYIPLTKWTVEDDTFINRLFGTLIVEPTSVRELVGQLCRQVGFTVWWDEIDQEVQFQAIRQPSTPPLTLTDDDDFLAGSTRVKEQQKERISQVWVYYGVIDPTEDLEEARNYRSVYVAVDADAESDDEYQKPKIEKIYARWIDRFNRAAAEDMASRILSRYRDAPRRFDFEMPWDREGVRLGGAYDARTRLMQTPDGQDATTRILVKSYERGEERLKVESEEFLFTPDPDDGIHRVIVDADTQQMADGSTFNLREAHDNIYTSISASDTVELIVEEGAILGSSDPSTPACEIGSWPSGTTVKVIIYGRIQGAAGAGGKSGHSRGGTTGSDGGDGQDGGIGLYTRYAIEVDNQGEIWGGAGGGGGGAGIRNQITFSDGSGGSGGGGAGFRVGPAGVYIDNGDSPGDPGEPGTTEEGGAGGAGGTSSGAGGDGGDPGQAGTAGSDDDAGANSGGAAGAAGAAVDGDSYITYTTTGDIRGSQVN